ncbi:MAG TPA: diacylglycerol kinase family protein [Myxococcota bacterium]|nr:diacylglycerol kinase family protein [Myxococcota bacterium]
MTGSILLVGNPTAQSGKAAERIRHSLEAMRSRGWSAHVMETLPSGRTVGALRERLDEDEGIEVVVYLGGDGTFAEVAKGILAAKRKRLLGMLPSGTANDQGKSFGVSAARGALARNLDVIAARHTTLLDVGKVGRIGLDGRVDDLNHVFHSVGWGMQSDILQQRNQDREAVKGFPLLSMLYRDQLVYAGAAFGKLMESYVEPIKFDAHVRVDGNEHHLQGLTDLVINATSVYGGMWVLDREAEPDDGRFELVPVHGRREWASKALRDLAQVPLWEEHLAAFGVKHRDGFSGGDFDVELVRIGEDEVSSQVDGEEWVSGSRFRLSVLRQELPIITPADWVPPWRPPG